MAVKRGHIDLDPDYEDVTEQQTKRQRVLEEDAKEATRQKIENIINQQFTMEIQNKEEEIDEVDQRLNQCQLVIDRLRACIIANFYSKAGQQRFSKVNQNTNEPPCIHPTVKEHIGKAPKNYPSPVDTSDKGDNPLPVNINAIKIEPVESSAGDVCTFKTDNIEKTQTPDTVTTKQDTEESRSSRFKMKKRIVVGNVSKYIPVDRREENDQSTHKWLVYVRGSKEEPRIDHYVKKVWFFLHPSYRPNDLVEVSQPPFHLTRRGWGEFPVRVQLHFKDNKSKRVDVIHQLKLDRTYTGLQTLGSETLVDIELEKEKMEEKQLPVSMPLTFDLKTQLKNLPENEQNITISEHVSPRKKAKVAPMVNGISIEGEGTPMVPQNQNKNKVVCGVTGQTNKAIEVKQNNQFSLLKKAMISPKTDVCATSIKKSVPQSPQSVHILLGGVGSVTNPHFPDSKGDNRKESPSKGHNHCNGKGDSLMSKNMEKHSAKEDKSAVILQGIGSLSTKITPSQNQMRLSSGNTTSLLNSVNMDGVSSVRTKSNIVTVPPTIQRPPNSGMLSKSTVSKPSLLLGHLTQPAVRNSATVVQPNIQTSKPNTVIVRPTVQKSQSNMLLIQTAPQTTRPSSTMVQQNVKSNTMIVSPTIPTTKTSSGLVQTGGKTGAVILQSSQSASTSVLQAQQSPITPQTLYYRCKDAQGNIFLVPQQLLKQVIQPSAKPATFISSSGSSPMCISVASSAASSSKVSLSSSLVIGVNSPVKPGTKQPLISTTINSNKSHDRGKPNQNTPIILSVNPGQTSSQKHLLNPSKSLLKSAITYTAGQDSSVSTGHSVINCNSTQVKVTNSVSQTSSNIKQQMLVIPSSKASILSSSSQNKKNEESNKKNIPQTIVTKPSIVSALSTSQKSGGNLLLTVNPSNGKTLVLPTQSLNSNSANVTFSPGASLLVQPSQKSGMNKSNPSVVIQKQTTNLKAGEANSEQNVLGEKSNLSAQSTVNKTFNMQKSVAMTTPSISSASIKCVTSTVTSCQSSLTSQGQLSTSGQLQVTPQGLKIIVNTSNKNQGNSSNNLNSISSTGSMCDRGFTSKNKTLEEPVIKIDSAEKVHKGNGISILPKEFQKPLIPKSHSSSLALKNITSKYSENSQSLLPNTATEVPLLTLTSGIEGHESALSSQQNSILGKIGGKKIVVDLCDLPPKRIGTGEKRIICLRKKSENRWPPSSLQCVKEINPIYRSEDFPDMLSLVKAAVKRHPVVSIDANKFQHPYCASSAEEWLSWKVGKRRASEWQRAAFCRKFIKNHIKGETHKGTKLWTTKKIMLWCRLHAFSPHYLESTLHPFGVELTADRIGKKFITATDSGEIMTEADKMSRGNSAEIHEEEDVDILNTEEHVPKKKVKEKVEIDLRDVDIIEPSEPAGYIQDTCQKIGIKFEPVEISPSVYSSTSEDMIFSVMKSFVGDVLTETFASKVSNGRYPDSLGMTDVFQALNNMSQSDFLTNMHLGVKATDSSTVHR